MVLKKHIGTNTYVILSRSFVDRDFNVDGNLIVGRKVYFWGDLAVSGTLELGKSSEIKGNLTANHALLGPSTHIKGNVQVENDLTLLDGARIDGDVLCGGNALIRPGVMMDHVQAGGDVKLVGKVNTKRVKAGGKVVSRTS
ncbi:MAG: polymer-forming cytoskeletal protein [Methanocellales archaeon]|nr:polymer-forming cytoskeletal protein [Methanocellales archaeon]MDD3291328.1 polymer-forming cytoskeletal protein [Methanocellales archaeon]MDD5235822.1 polymer-forming cytoskeletal protein [Methanocellales archaeon]MDD5484417.1 polymer-forming cytoskeletal protein [Methanocellales archaeon]